MYDSILHTTIADTISPYLKRQEVLADTFSTSFTPFDYIPTDEQSLFFDIDTAVVDSLGGNLSGGVTGLPLLFTTHIYDVIFLLFACSFILLSLFARNSNFRFLSSLKELISFASRSRSAFKEQISISSIWVKTYLVFQSVLISAILTSVVLWQNSDIFPLPTNNILLLIALLFGGIMLFVLMKYIVYRLVDFTFPDWRLSEWNSQYFTVIGLLGLVLFFPALFVAFAPEYFMFSFWIIMGAIIIIMFFYYRNLLIIFLKNNIGVLNYFLYLCAIEIVPLILLYRGGTILANIVGK